MQDEIWSVDPSTGELFAAKISALTRATREIIRLQGEGFSLSCTPDHPLYDPLTKDWAPAGDWVLGLRSDLLLVPEGGQAARVTAVHTRERSAGLSEVTDLSVDHELHNFVAANVLVHNKKYPVTQRSCRQDTENGELVVLVHSRGCALPDGGTGEADCSEGEDGGVVGRCLSSDAP